MQRHLRPAVTLLMATLLGCVHVPPGRVAQDRFGYGQAIADSWKRQMLINIVRLRYGDAPTFLEVTSVINTYSEAGSVNAGISVLESPDPSELGAGGSRTWSNTPTVTYQPLTGQKFTSNLLRPIPPAEVFRMLQAGWPVPVIFRTAVRSINGVSNQAFGRRSEPEFDRLVEALTRLQRSEALGIRVEAREGGDSVLVVFRPDSVVDAARADSRIVREALRLEEGATEYRISMGAVPRDKTEIAILTRSMLEIMLELASGIDVPASDLAEGRTLTPDVPPGEQPADPVVRVRSGQAPPADAFVAVPYRGGWFWIEDTDAASKGKFTFLMILSSMAESAPAGAGPLVTVGTGR